MMRSVSHAYTQSVRYNGVSKRLVERYGIGYPRFTALMSMSRQSQVFRKFRMLRLRMLLYRQDEVVELEERLQEVEDDGEDTDLFRGNRRLDRNKERKSILKQLDKKLAAYGVTPFSRLESD